MSKIIRLNINGEQMPILIMRKRSSSMNTYKKLFVAMFNDMTSEQIMSLIQTKNSKPFIILDDIVAQFDYEGFIGEQSSFCICGVSIQYQYSIRNLVTDNQLIVGSTCVSHWDNSTIPDDKPGLIKSALKQVFNVLKNIYKNMPIMPCGKYKKKKMKWIVKNDLAYARYVYAKFEDQSVVQQMEQTILKYQ